MPSTTRYAQVKVAQTNYSVVAAVLTVGVSHDIFCRLPVNTYSKVGRVEIKLIGRPHTDRGCVAHCFAVGELRAICVKPINTYGDTLKMSVVSNKQTRFSVLNTAVNVRSIDNLKCVLYNYEYSNVAALVVSRSTQYDSVRCILSISALTEFTVVETQVGLTSTTHIGCVVHGEAHSTIKCQMTSNTKRSDIGCVISQAVDLDSYTQVKCSTPRMVGEPIDYVALEVLLGRRHYSTVKCVMEVPAHNYNDLNCITSYIKGGTPSWTRFVDSDHIFVRLMNVGDMDVRQAVLQDNKSVIPAVSTERLSSIWQIRFDKISDISNNYVIVVTLEPGSKIIVIDKAQGNFTI